MNMRFVRMLRAASAIPLSGASCTTSSGGSSDDSGRRRREGRGFFPDTSFSLSS